MHDTTACLAGKCLRVSRSLSPPHISNTGGHSDHLIHHCLLLFAILAGVFWAAHAKSLSAECRNAYMQLMLACGLLVAKTHTKEQIPVLVRRTLEAVVLVELHLPCSHLGMKLHSLLHAPLRVIAAGSLTPVSCWPLQHNWGLLQPLATNTAHPEATIMHKALDRQVADLQHARHPENFSSSFKQAVIAAEPRRELYTPSVLSNFCEGGGMQAVAVAGPGKPIALKDHQLQLLHASFVAVNAEYQRMWELFSRYVWMIR